MPKAYKITSDPFFVNGSITESGNNTYTQNEVSLPLDSLNQEGVLVHAVYFTSTEPSRVANTQAVCALQVTSTSKTGTVGANDANLLARRQIITIGGAAEFNVFFAVQGTGNSAVMSGEFRMVCSRVKLDSAAYAALVTNELTS